MEERRKKDLIPKVLCVILVTGHGDQAGTKFPLCWVAFTVLEGMVQAAGREPSSTVSSNCEPYELH